VRVVLPGRQVTAVTGRRRRLGLMWLRTAAMAVGKGLLPLHRDVRVVLVWAALRRVLLAAFRSEGRAANKRPLRRLAGCLRLSVGLQCWEARIVAGQRQRLLVLWRATTTVAVRLVQDSRPRSLLRMVRRALLAL